MWTLVQNLYLNFTKQQERDAKDSHVNWGYFSEKSPLLFKFHQTTVENLHYTTFVAAQKWTIQLS